jgi:ATP-dependent DNA ligase
MSLPPSTARRWATRGNSCKLPLSLRKANLDRHLSRQFNGIFVTDYEQGKIGDDLFRAACRMGLEGIVSKHRGRAYRGGGCRP